jgi:hypothetical protein
MDSQPGCFGSILYRALKTRRCQQCPFVTDCGTLAETNSVKLREWEASLRESQTVSKSQRKMAARGIAPVAAPVVKEKTVAVAATAVPSSASGVVLKNKKPRELVEDLCKKGVKFEDFRTCNPFEKYGKKYVGVAFEFFKANKVVHKHSLNDFFVDKLKWEIGTAGSHVNIIFDAFEYLGIIEVKGMEGTLKE